MTARGADVRAAYDAAAEAWRRGPERVYARLAEALLTTSPVDLRGARVLDVGAGTATAGRAALERGAATVVATDVAAQMLHGRPPRMPAVLADGGRLPFRSGAFDLVAAAYCLGHLTDPRAALVEMRRVGGAVVASAFAPGPPHPAKTAVDAALAKVGFELPTWYLRQKDTLEPRVDDPEALNALATDAGFTEVTVSRIDVDTGLVDPADVVSWRLGMAHLAPFVATLDPGDLARAREEAERAVAPFTPVVIGMLALSAS